MDERLFTRDEANALLPALRPLLARLQEAQQRLGDRALLQRLRAAAAGNGGGVAARDVMATGDEFGRIAAEIEGLGVVVRDPASGLVDFPAERNGAAVYLCWRVGEDEVGHWHDRDSGFIGRQPL
ncbi:MAG TPA: DUF2203 domain-containing protein [Candidatus Dormibacteraeota bacterium]|nr:DUF2203 domain-containing protein [Candidatus Dormibacteraeota bacterium]